MSYPLKGTEIRAASLSAAVSFEIETDRRELALLRNRFSDDECRAVRERAAADVLASGGFVQSTEST